MPVTDNIAIAVLLFVLVGAAGVLKIVWASREKLQEENKDLNRQTAIRETKIEAHMEHQLAVNKALLRGQRKIMEKLGAVASASE